MEDGGGGGGGGRRREDEGGRGWMVWQRCWMLARDGKMVGGWSYSGRGLEHSPSPPLQAQPRSLCLAMIIPRLRTRFSYVSHSSRCCMYALYSASVPPPEKSGLSKSGGVGTAGMGRRGRGFAGAGAAWVRGFLCGAGSGSDEAQSPIFSRVESH